MPFEQPHHLFQCHAQHALAGLPKVLPVHGVQCVLNVQHHKLGYPEQHTVEPVVEEPGCSFPSACIMCRGMVYVLGAACTHGCGLVGILIEGTGASWGWSLALLKHEGACTGSFAASADWSARTQKLQI